jgi:hypothetical protein
MVIIYGRYFERAEGPIYTSLAQRARYGNDDALEG